MRRRREGEHPFQVPRTARSVGGTFRASAGFSDEEAEFCCGWRASAAGPGGFPFPGFHFWRAVQVVRYEWLEERPRGSLALNSSSTDWAFGLQPSSRRALAE